MVFGTFDNLHPGHLNYFQQARCFGEKTMKRLSAKGAKVNGEAIKKVEIKGGVELIAVVARDKNVLRIKGRAAQENEKMRLKKVRAALKSNVFRARAVLGALKNQWTVLKKYRPAVICLGYDQKVDLARLKREMAKSCPGCKIKRMKAHHPEKYKSSYCWG